MPKKKYQPNQKEYYSRRKEYPVLLDIVGNQKSPLTTEEEKVWRLNDDNYKAYLYSLFPQEFNEEDFERLKTRIEKIPGYQENHPDQEKRRQITKKAQDKIVAVAMKNYHANKNYSMDRLNRIFLENTDDKEKNDQIVDIMEHGTPKQKGEIVEKRVRDAMKLFEHCMKEPSDEEVIENLEEYLDLNIVVANSQMIRDAVNANKFEVSQEVMDMLNRMELNSVFIDYTLQRIKALANPISEFIDFTTLTELDSEVFDKIHEELAYMLEEDAEPELEDYISTIDYVKTRKGMKNRFRFYDQVEKDFDTKESTPYIKIVSKYNTIAEEEYRADKMANSLDGRWDEPYVLVTSDGADPKLYKVDRKGEVYNCTPDDLQRDYMSDLKTKIEPLLNEVLKANKGFFVGSKEYSRAMKSLIEFSELLKKTEEPYTEENLKPMKEKLQKTLENCNKYVTMKGGVKDRDVLKAGREKNRFDAIYAVSECFTRNMSCISLQEEYLLIEKTRHKDVKLDMDEMAKLNTNTTKHHIPISDAGRVADNLREEVEKNLEEITKNPEKHKGRERQEVMAKLVVLQLMRMGRKKSPDGKKILAGAVEKNYYEKKDQIIEAICHNEAFEAMWDSKNKNMVRDFIATNGARVVANFIVNSHAQNKLVENKKAVAEKNLEQNQLKENGPMV